MSGMTGGATKTVQQTRDASNILAPPADALRSLVWYVRFRWLMVLALLAALIVGVRLPDAAALPGAVALPWLSLAGVAVALAGSNGLLELTRRQLPRLASRLLPAALVVDIVLLSGLLLLAGGPFNPFSILLLVPVVAGAVVLRPALAWALAGLAASCYSALFVIRLPAWPGGETGPGESGGLWPSDWVSGLIWLAFVSAMILVTATVATLSATLRRRTRALLSALDEQAALEQQQARTRMAAEVARRLGAPLSTISISAGELQRHVNGRAVDGLGDDLRLIQAQVDRCSDALRQLGAEAAGMPREAPELVPIDTLVAGLRRQLGADLGGRIDVLVAPDLTAVWAPPRGLLEVLVTLVRHGFEASEDDGEARVLVVALEQDGLVNLRVKDYSDGASSELLTREARPTLGLHHPGQGSMLGLFLARSFMDGLGGSLDLASESGSGTTVTLRFPNRPGVR